MLCCSAKPRRRPAHFLSGLMQGKSIIPSRSRGVSTVGAGSSEDEDSANGMDNRPKKLLSAVQKGGDVDSVTGAQTDVECNELLPLMIMMRCSPLPLQRRRTSRVAVPDPPHERKVARSGETEPPGRTHLEMSLPGYSRSRPSPRSLRMSASSYTEKSTKSCPSSSYALAVWNENMGGAEKMRTSCSEQSQRAHLKAVHTARFEGRRCPST